MATPEQKTVDGFEMQFGVDHLGHWSLTALLLPALLGTAGARIVTVTSSAHLIGRAVDPANPHLVGRYRPWRAYGQAKLANFHFGIGLQQKLQAAGRTTASLIAHPGLSNTDLQTVSVRETNGGASQRFFEILAQRTGMSRGRRSSFAAARRGRSPTPRAASSTARCSSTAARPSASRSSVPEWSRRLPNSGRCPHVRRESRSRLARGDARHECRACRSCRTRPARAPEPRRRARLPRRLDERRRASRRRRDRDRLHPLRL